MRKVRILLFAVAIASVAAGYAISIFNPEKQADERIYLREIGPDLLFSQKKANPPHYASDQGIIAFNSHDIVPGIRGYAGPVKVMIALSPDGRITGLKIIDHQETKNYVHYLETPEYLRQFIGKSIADRFQPDSDLDGISRATVSVEALAKTVRDSSRLVASSVYGIESPSDGAESPSGLGWLWYLVLFSVSFLLYFTTRRSGRLLRTRDICLAVSIPLTGMYLSAPFSILHVFNLLLLRPSSSLLWYAIIICTSVSILIAGRFYCGWLCPFGAVSEFLGRLPFRKWVIPHETDGRWRGLKYILLGIVITIVFTSKRVEFGSYETYLTLFSLHGNFLTWSLVGITLLANLRIARFWCRYLCPVAAFTGLFSRRAKGYPSRHDCPIGNQPNPLISECIRCNRCYRSTAGVRGSHVKL